MDYLADRGFNVVFPVVWNKDILFTLVRLPWMHLVKKQDPLFASQGRDPLQEIITEAHRRGMEVIPWFEYGFASVYGDASGGHIINANPHWAAKGRAGDVLRLWRLLVVRRVLFIG